MPHEKSHIEPSEHSTKQVDEFLERRDKTTEELGSDGSPAIKPTQELDPDGKASGEQPKNPRI